MRNQLFYILLAFLFIQCNNQSSSDYEEKNDAISVIKTQEKNPAKALIQEMTEAVGGIENFKAQKDVEYEYTYRDPEGLADISTERYIFDGELSWASYKTHNKNIFPGEEGEVIQSYNGKSTFTSVAGKIMEDEKAIWLADFMRKTNYYWFTMMYKLLDSGINYELMDDQKVGAIPYKRVKVSYEQGVGDVQDIYLLYIHPDTKLVDQFLFTVMDFGIKDPLLMKITYEEINGLKLPAYRKYAYADWEGNIKEDKWTEEISKNIKFNNGFTKDMFSN